MTDTIALIGAGAMGGAIGARLVATGTRLVVFDLDPAKVAPLVAAGASASPSAAAAATGARAVILSLNAPHIVRAAVFGAGGVAEGAGPGTLIIDMSSIDPEATKALATDAAAKGLHWVDSPLSGGIPKAATGELTLMQGGTPEAVAAAQVILSKVASNQTRMGGSGAGQTTKLINQVLCGLGFLAVAEATALAEAAGVDVTMIPKALAGGRADSAILQEYMPRFAARDYRRTGRIDNMVKDLNGAADLARLTHTPMPLTALCAEIHRMLTAAGLGGEDQAALMEFFSAKKNIQGPNKDLFE
jgi:2-hydroxy-3-oxopropionate reductase